MISDEYVGIKISEAQASAIENHVEEILDQILITAECPESLIAGAMYAFDMFREKIEPIQKKLEAALEAVDDSEPEKVFYLMTDDFSVEFSAPTKEEAIAFAKGKKLESYKIVEEIIQ